MPIYMDRHDVGEMVSAEHVAQLHQEDLKIQDQFDCRGLTYWFDDRRKTAFCLIEAPSKEALQDMHNSAHGEIPHAIIEVDPNVVESFLGRIEDPEKKQDTDLNIIDDPAFRTIMRFQIEILSIDPDNSINRKSFFEKSNTAIGNKLAYFEGRIVKQGDAGFLASFDSVSNAVNCAVQLQAIFQNFTKSASNRTIDLKMGLSTGVPVTEKQAIFEDSIKMAMRMCSIAKANIVVTSEVKSLYKSENLNSFIDKEWVIALSAQDEKFLNQFMDFIEETWMDPEIKVDDFNKAVGFSKSQTYRTMISLFDQSPNSFLKEYRLNKALKLLTQQNDNISEIAFDAGFSSPSYFSKCFQKRYGIIPSDCLRTN